MSTAIIGTGGLGSAIARRLASGGDIVRRVVKGEIVAELVAMVPAGQASTSGT